MLRKFFIFLTLCMYTIKAEFSEPLAVKPDGLLGDSCMKNRHCSASEGFQCIQATCQCDRTRSEYNAELKLCVGLTGRQCIQDHCTQHVHCETTVCVCPRDYLESASGRCFPQVGHLENCTDDAQCEQEEGLGLKCIQGVCDCDPNNSVYATVRRSFTQHSSGSFRRYEGETITRCVPLAGQQCADRLCAPGAYCKDDNLSPRTCECQPTLTLSKRGTCVARENGACAVNDECIDGLACVDGRCKCKYEDQVYSSITSSCSSKIGGPCDEHVACIPHSYCQIRNDRGAGHCVCNEGFVPDFQDYCEVAEGGKCNSTRRCDSIANLACVNGFCQCKRVQAQFDAIQRKCIGKVGARCSVSEKNDCMENSSCVQTHPKLPARCACNVGYSEASDYTCQGGNKLTTGNPIAEAKKLGGQVIT